MTAVIELDADVVECGGSLTGDLRGADAARIELGYRVEGAHPTTATAASLSVRPETATIGIDVPDRGPISYSGELFAVEWTLSVHAADDTVLAEIPVTVLPHGGLTLWARQAAPPPTEP